MRRRLGLFGSSMQMLPLFEVVAPCAFGENRASFGPKGTIVTVPDALPAPTGDSLRHDVPRESAESDALSGSEASRAAC